MCPKRAWSGFRTATTSLEILPCCPSLRSLMNYKKEIATAILDQCNHIHTVLNKTSRLEGERRVARLEVLAGVGNTITTHREFGFIYHLDVARVFFNSRLGSERMRVASQVKDGEDVLVPFAGSGPFVVPVGCPGRSCGGAGEESRGMSMAGQRTPGKIALRRGSR